MIDSITINTSVKDIADLKKTAIKASGMYLTAKKSSANLEQRLAESAEGRAVKAFTDSSSAPLARGTQSTTDSDIIPQSTNEVPFNQLVDNGYPVIPVYHKDKRPVGKGWQNRVESTEAERAQWKKNKFSAGILTKFYPAVDIDIRDEKLSIMVKKFALEQIGAAPIRIGLKPKCLLACRADIPFKKISSKKYKSPNGDEHQIEILGDGQQFVSHGIHSDTGKPYYYLDKDLANIPSSELPFLSPMHAEKIIAYFESIVPDDWVDVGGKKTTHTTVTDCETTHIDDIPDMSMPHKLKKQKPAGYKPNTKAIEEALGFLDPDDYDSWVKTGMGLHDEYDADEAGLELYEKWSKLSSKYQPGDAVKKWDSFSAINSGEKAIQIGTLVKRARDAGWQGSLVTKRELIPTISVSNDEKMPMDCLPDSLISMAEEGARYTRTKPDAIVLSGLVGVSSMLTSNIVIEERGAELSYNCSIGIIITDGTGTRKTPRFKIGAAGFLEFEKSQTEQYEINKPMFGASRKYLQGEIKKIEKAATFNIEEHAKKTKELEEIPTSPPTLMAGDVTEEKLIRLMSQNNGRITVFSDDARSVLSNIMGKYKGDSNTGEQVYINGLTGSPIIFHRQGNGQAEGNEIRINRPSINMLLFVQPDKINELISKPSLLDSGLLARVLLYPGNTDITHMLDEQYDEAEFDETKAAEFRRVFHRLDTLWDSDVITKVVLSDEAKKARVDTMKWLGKQTAGRWSDQFDITNKMITIGVKLACILEAIENAKSFVPPHGATENTVTISLEMFEKAWHLTKFLVNKNLEIYANLAHDTLMKQAKTVINNIHQDKKKSSSQNHFDWKTKGFKNNSLFRNSQSAALRESMGEILSVLVEYGHLYHDGSRYYPVE